MRPKTGATSAATCTAPILRMRGARTAQRNHVIIPVSAGDGRIVRFPRLPRGGSVAVVIPFRSWRYHPNTLDLYKDQLSPPYDIIEPELQDELYGRSPHNVVRVDLPREKAEPGEEKNRYARAAATLKRWKKEDVLVRDPVPKVTVVEEDFTGPDGVKRTRRGILACLRLEEFSAGVVFPHEATLSGPKEDRYRLMDPTTMNLSPVFLLYSSPQDAIMTAWTEAAGCRELAAGSLIPGGHY